MAQQHLSTLMLQARAFLDAREPADAMRLLEQARMLARDDIAALAEVRAAQAKAAVLMGRGDDAVSYMREAIDLSRDMEAHLGWLVQECERRDLDETADALRAISHIAGYQRVPARRRSLAKVAAVFVSVSLLIGALYYMDVLSFSSRRSDATHAARLDFERIKDNVGLVIVSAKYTYMDGHSVTYPVGTGSTFAVSADGHLLTNRHVTAAREEAPQQFRDNDKLFATQDWWKITVCFGAEQSQHFDAQLVYESPYRDLAILKVDRKFPTYLRVAPEWAPGDDVYAAGFPGAVSDAMAAKSASDILRKAAAELDKSDADISMLQITDAAYDVTVTRGVISAVREIDGQKHVQTDAAINPGNSGGPLLIRTCQLVGINTWKSTQSEAYNFALSLDEMRDELRPFVELE